MNSRLVLIFGNNQPDQLLPPWSAIASANNRKIITWAKSESWAREMAKCPQDPQWHAEGDVWTHTEMVCSQLEQLTEWRSLDRSTQLILLFTALFHDAGKPKTTSPDPETGRLRSPKHSIVG